MLEPYTSYPVKLVSRRAGATRSRKAGITWFVVGVAFTLGCVGSITPLLKHNSATAQATIPTAIAALSDDASKHLEKIVSASPAEAAPAAPAQVEAVTYPLKLDMKVQKGDTFSSLLSDAGVGYDEAQNVYDATRKVFNPRHLDVGSSVALQIDKAADGSKIVRSMSLPLSELSTLEVNRIAGDNFSVKKIDAPVFKKLAHAGGRIDSSLYQTGVDAGMPPALLNELISAYSYDVDFQREIKEGNNIDVLFERMETKDGVVAGNGNLVYAELELADRRLKLYRYTAKDGTADFYNEKGESIRKALLRTPINGAKITSGYGMRNHPLLGYTRMHKGVDFGAPIGTPIYAAGDGTVEFVGQKTGYGNYLKLKHSGPYSSAYAHLSRFASGITPGKKVKQGQIVAYVGMTGMATGPHLHYEILVNNEQVNPANVKFKTGNVLAGKDLVAFKSNMNKIESKLASIAKGNNVAMADNETIGVAN